MYSTPKAANNKLITQSTNGGAVSSFNFSNFTKPDWIHPASYKRFNQDVLEIPADPSVKIRTALSASPTSKAVYQQQYSRSSFLLLKDSTGYKAYVMTVIADSAYVKGDLTKLDHNKYNKHDPDFSGVVLYYTPAGTYISGWAYKNGTISGSLVPGEQAQVQNAPTNGLSTDNLKTNLVQTCYTWYQTVSADVNNNGVYTTYPTTELETTCTNSGTLGDSGGSGGSTGTGTGTGSGSGSTTTTPPPCVPPAVGNSVSGSHLAVDVVQQPPGGGGDGGFPPPTTTNPCVSVTTQTVSTTVIPCVQKDQVNAFAQNATIAQQNHVIYNTLNTGHEWGNEQNLTTFPPANTVTYVNMNDRTDLNDTKFTPNFTWDSTNGYTINISHGHPAGGAPSPADVFQLFVNSLNSNLQAGGSTALNYYMNNAAITAITKDATYVVTCTNYTALANLYSTYRSNPTQFNALYESTANDNGGSTEFALLTMFGGSINLFKSTAPNSATFLPIQLNNKGTVIVNPCPAN